MQRAYYSDKVSDFLVKNYLEIFGELNNFGAEQEQKDSWKKQIEILKEQLSMFSDGYILFEYSIPRIGKRIDTVLLYKGIVFLLEFKVGGTLYPSQAIEQVTDYALDLNCFHKESDNKLLVPVLICTDAPEKITDILLLKENILTANCCNRSNIATYVKKVCDKYPRDNFIAEEWESSIYTPTPTIIEAAQALYGGHNVEDISRNDASAINLTETTKAINDIIDFSKQNNRKSICFVTGVPGAGKTLAGLNISINRKKVDKNEHAVFLSGNGPLVDVLQEALARDSVKQNKVKKSEALRESKTFIQVLHHFRDDAIKNNYNTPPIEKVVIFDEAQRAWDEKSLTNFMGRKKQTPNFNMSEPDFLIKVMDLHADWSVIVCLIGGGQEINTGEAGLSEWFDSLRKKYPHWKVYVSEEISDYEYTGEKTVDELILGLNYERNRHLHLSVSLRSFRSEKVSGFVKAVLDVDTDEATKLLNEFCKDYHINITRDLKTAKKWILDKANGSERYGMTASSGAKRLRKHGIWVQNKVDAPMWFLNGKTDVRSSYYLEETATEFDVQGLELDWSIVCWDANFRFNGTSFEYFDFKGTKWQNIHQDKKEGYLKNAYRVLLTRARQGFVIYIPTGDENDSTRKPEFYEGVYNYFKMIGIKDVENL